MQLARLCKDCRAIDECTRRYGKYWPDRSQHGRGCCNPIDPPAKRPAPPPEYDQPCLF